MSNNFDEVLTKAADWKKSNKNVAIATVVSTWGSSPRPIGSRMAINQDLEVIGSVSGGCIEGEVIIEAQNVIKTGTPKLLNFGVSNTQAWDVGLACGGKVEVFVERIGKKSE